MSQTDALKSEYSEWIKLCRKAEGVGLESAKEYRAELENESAKLGEPLYLMIVGEGDAGKSALVNAFLERTVARVGVLSKTWCISMYIPDEYKDHAELIYKDKSSRSITIDEAIKIERSIETEFEDGELKESAINPEYLDIEELRKHYKGLPWPPQGADVVIIDTPGFSQIRPSHEETTQYRIKFDGAEGIHFENSDGFERYYSKADIVFWCVPYTDTGDYEFDRHIRQVAYQNKDIYAVITKVDELDDQVKENRITEKEKKEIIQAAIDDLKKYPQIRGHLTTKLPPIAKTMSKDMQGKLAVIHKETSLDLQKFATDILKKSGKDIVREKGLQTIQYKLIQDIRLLYGFYEKNYEVCGDSIEQISYIMEQQERELKTNIRNRTNQFYSDIFSDRVIREKWEACKPDRERFKRQIQTALDKSGITDRCEQEMSNVMEYSLSKCAKSRESILWTEVNMGSLRDEGSQEVTKPYDAKSIQLPTAHFDVNGLDLPGRLGDSFSHILDPLFKKDAKKPQASGIMGFAKSVKDKAVQVKDEAKKAVKEIRNRDEEIIKLTRECIVDEVKTYQTQIFNEFHIWAHDTKQSLVREIKNAYQRHTGMDYDRCLFKEQKQEFERDIQRLKNNRGYTGQTTQTRTAPASSFTAGTAPAGTADVKQSSPKGQSFTSNQPKKPVYNSESRSPETVAYKDENRIVLQQRDNFIAEWGPYLEQCAASGTIRPEADCIPIMYQYWYYNYYRNHPDERLIEVIFERTRNSSLTLPQALALFPSSEKNGKLSDENVQLLDKVKRDLEYEYIKHCDELSTKVYEREFNKKKRQLEPYINSLSDYWKKWKTYQKSTPESKKEINSFSQFLEKNGMPKGLLDIEKTVSSVKQYRRIQWSSGDTFEERFRRDYRVLIDRVLNYSE